MNTTKRKVTTEAGFSLLELLITVAILAALALLIAPGAAKLIRRSQSLAAFSTIRQVLASARLQAVKRGVNVVVLMDLTPENKIHFHTFQDRANDETSPLPADEETGRSNFVQDTFINTAANEPTLGDVILPSNVVVWKQGGSPHDDGVGIAFDEYGGNTSLVNRIAFLPTGGIVPPEDTASGQPTSAGGRGIYFADTGGKNFFRVTIDSEVSGRLRVDKYGPSGYEANGWKWY